MGGAIFCPTQGIEGGAVGPNFTNENLICTVFGGL